MKTLGQPFLKTVLFLSLPLAQISSSGYADNQNGAHQNERQDEVLSNVSPKAGLGELAGRAAVGGGLAIVGAVGIGYLGAIIGNGTSDHITGNSDCNAACSGFLLGALAGLPLGAAIGVKLFRDPENVESSFGYTLVGSILGEAATFGVFAVLASNSDTSISGVGAVLVPIGLTVAGGVGAYQWSRQFKGRASTQGNLPGLRAPSLALVAHATASRIRPSPVVNFFVYDF